MLIPPPACSLRRQAGWWVPTETETELINCRAERQRGEKSCRDAQRAREERRAQSPGGADARGEASFHPKGGQAEYSEGCAP